MLFYPIGEGKSGQQAVDILLKRLEILGVEKTGNYSVDCDTYQSQILSSASRSVHVLHNSEQPTSCFSVLDNGACLVADLQFDILMQKMKSFYQCRKNIRVEVRGQRHVLGDFIIKVGSVIVGQMTSFKGILVEVEYLPCIVPSECWNLMREFISGFLSEIDLDTPNLHFRKSLDMPQGSNNAILQYLEHFHNIRKAVNAGKSSTEDLNAMRSDRGKF